MNNTHKNSITKTASAAISQGVIVKLGSDSSCVAACSATDANAIGVTLDSAAQNDNVAVALLGIANHTVQTVASGAISAGAKVYLAANGKISASGTIYVGIALTAASADGDLVELAHCTPIDETTE